MKPANIMLNSQSNVKLIDFGEAKIVDNYEVVCNSPKSVRSDGQSSFFGRVLNNNKTKRKKDGTFVGTHLY